jgi:hypothetical protein
MVKTVTGAWLTEVAVEPGYTDLGECIWFESAAALDNSGKLAQRAAIRGSNEQARRECPGMQRRDRARKHNLPCGDERPSFKRGGNFALVCLARAVATLSGPFPVW